MAAWLRTWRDIPPASALSASPVHVIEAGVGDELVGVLATMALAAVGG